MTSALETRPRTGLAGGSARQPSVLARAVLGLFRAYQLARIGRVSPCRFTPTCSQYAVEAVERHGARRGVLLAARRLGRCRPGGPSGYDPIPE
jgi:putative membrane protein insertion efficiency factor